MANWKEKGVVPDSDDEDGLESQDTASLLHEHCEERTVPCNDKSYCFTQNTALGLQHDANIFGSKPATPSIESISALLSSSPLSPIVFKIPDVFCEPEEDFPRYRGSSILPVTIPEQEKASKSYVQINSPVSSILSSLSSSQALPSWDSHTAADVLRNPTSSSSEAPLNDAGIGQQRPLVAQSDIVYPMKRALRHRNPIQLHPYVVEQEKYRQTLKSRGIAPMRIAHSQDAIRPQSRNEVSPNLETQEDDLQDVLSTPIRIASPNSDWDPPSSIQSQRSQLYHEDADIQRADGLMNDENNDVPDIEALVTQSHELPSKIEPKRPLKSSSRRGSRSKGHDAAKRTFRKSTTSMNINGAPASPPTTSSPVLPPVRCLARVASGTIHQIAASDAHDESHSEDHQVVALPPTPLTSAMKANLSPIFLDSASDSEDPFALSSKSSSSSDESIRLRKVGRRVRGVLPASHVRLDLQKKLPQISTLRNLDIHRDSPVKALARKGVAIPKSCNKAQEPFAFPLLSEESEDEHGNHYQLVTHQSDPPQARIIFETSRHGSAEEIDTIDAMLPARKRQRSDLYQGSKTNKAGMVSKYRSQSRIMEYLEPSVWTSSSIPSKRKLHDGGSARRRPKQLHTSPHAAAPVLSVLDFVDTGSQPLRQSPQFIKIAVRTARSRRGQGRQSPTRKFIRLATREDTELAQSVLGDWKEGRIRPKDSKTSRLDTVRGPLEPVHMNVQTKRPASRAILYHATAQQRIGCPTSRKLVVSSKVTPKRIKDFVKQQPERLNILKQTSLLKSALSIGHETQNKKMQRNNICRPAQLESFEVDPSSRRPSAAFKSFKNTLDSVYHDSRGQTMPDSELQFQRFLVEKAVAPSSILTEIGSTKACYDVELGGTSNQHIQKPTNRKQRFPKRVDAGAAKYRQPSSPLVLDLQNPKQTIAHTDDRHLLTGLGKFGTKYPIHFDIFPLQQGIFFHQETIIGSGYLRNILHDEKSCPCTFTIPKVLKLGDKEFSWASWNESTSSDIGICFDWISEQIFLENGCHSYPKSPNALAVAVFVLRYIHVDLRFDETLGREEFISRMIPLVKDLSSRIRESHIASQDQGKQVIQAGSVCLMIAFLMLKLAKGGPECRMSLFELEDLLKFVAACCVRFLLIHGLDDIRSLYDNLQYLSFRENGIKEDQHAVQTWVTLVHVLTKAQILQGSFWDVVDSELSLDCLNLGKHAPTMEKLWYSLNTILPMCDFNDYGVLIPNSFKHSSRATWGLPQQMLRTLCSCYTANQRQSPGFNEYCRTIFMRCHHLMVNWGWWHCSGIIGTMFDFFSSQNLSHLRNEEVYHSPHFLEELGGDPCLDLDPEDRCFHIFLKVIALGIKHYRALNDVKAVRNLVARLLPNHDRQYPKEEAVHQRDLASLRNHYDLLCTLFWTAPPDQRPAIALLQDLVIADRSHKEACLISLRAWENLSRFVAATASMPRYYHPLIAWQSSFFSAMHQQYVGMELEVRQHAEILRNQSGDATTENHISRTISANKRSIVVSMCRSINSMAVVIKAAKTEVLVQKALNCDVLSEAMDPVIHKDCKITGSLLTEVAAVLLAYMDQIDALSPITGAMVNQAHTTSEDSQDSLDMMGTNWSRVEMLLVSCMIYELVVIYADQSKPLDIMIEKLSTLIRNRLEAIVSDRNESLDTLLVDCWARLIVMTTEDEAKKFQTFLVNGKNAIFENRATSEIANQYWPFFLAKLLEYNKKLADFPIEFNIGLEWLLSLMHPRPISFSERMLTHQLHRKGHYLCCSSDLHISDRTNMIQMAIRKMSSLIIEKSTEVDLDLALKTAERLFSDMLGEAMKAMQQYLESLYPYTHDHRNYLQFVQVIITDIKCYASDLKPLTEFFIHPSASYWPHETDPNLYAAGIIAYCIRLKQQPDKASFELFYYLHGPWKSALISDRLPNYCIHVQKGMKRLELARFMLSEFLPATLDAGVRAGGWLLCHTFLPIVSQKIGRLLDKSDSNTSWVFEHTLNILKIILNGVLSHSRKVVQDVNGVHPQHRGILVVLLKFWFSIAPYLRQYVERHPSQVSVLEEVTDPLSSFVYTTIGAFSMGDTDPVFSLPAGEFDTRSGKFTTKFAEIIRQDIEEHWQFLGDGGFGVVIRSRSGEYSAPQSLKHTLKEVLLGSFAGYEALFEDKDELCLPKKKLELAMDIYC